MLDEGTYGADCSVTSSSKGDGSEDVESNKGAAFESDDSIDSDDSVDPGGIKACCSVQSLPV